jgi:tRNA threonylcarbamoyladenosine biosynthesis protein TsaB
MSVAIRNTTLYIRTDKPEAELYIKRNDEIVASHRRHADRSLSDTILKSIDTVLVSQEMQLTDVSHIIVYQGPGSFTGLRIGISVANALAYGLGVPVVGLSGEYWLETPFDKEARSSGPVLPFYGQDAHITKPKK